MTPLGLAVRYLAHHPARSGVQILGASVALMLPLSGWIVGHGIEDTLLARADTTPIVVGRAGNPFDLTMVALYFHGEVDNPVPHDIVTTLGTYGVAVPLHVAHSAGGVPIVGTSVDYFVQRRLSVAEGRRAALLGEIVAGAGVGLRVGDRVSTDQTNLYDLSGSYPLILEVVGVLAPSDTPDDDALFTDVRTAWTIDGHLHGHRSVDADTTADHVDASPGLFLEQELDEATRHRFHPHGDLDALPISAVVVFPTSIRDRDQLLGDLALDPLNQAIEPRTVIGTILGIVVQIRDLLMLYFAAVAATTAAFLGLTTFLSARLRQDELRLLHRLGSSRYTVARVLAAEMGLVLGIGAAVASIVALAAWVWLDPTSGGWR